MGSALMQRRRMQRKQRQQRMQLMRTQEQQQQQMQRPHLCSRHSGRLSPSTPAPVSMASPLACATTAELAGQPAQTHKTLYHQSA